MLPKKFTLPEYVAVMECEPTASADVVSCALEFVKLIVPRAAVPSKKVTVPVGELPEEICTFAMNVTLCPTVDGLLLEITVVAVWIGFTDCVKTDEALPAKLASPEYFAVMECEPRASEVMENCALELESVAVPSIVAPSKNATVPVG